jgi:hypothetical protein
MVEEDGTGRGSPLVEGEDEVAHGGEISTGGLRCRD